ncbi:hypothetical protein DPEC_G00058270 [Dallia pectoralis]|uniref:Uncharacterized protein n=1 Tax=Dallia pectoralis TaxID=75939 RepID=A0ACC2H638_DALPE|nr:hypothetical protein DPEC_G00058270 [Dallia pectoralis]
MRLRRGFFHSMFLLVLNTITNYAWQLPSPLGVSMESINMRHFLKWRRHQSPCRTPVYSVQVQGEFELRFLNGTWENVLGCQQVNQISCDLTGDLGSDSDYNIRVRAECGSRVSTWAELERPFNRKETNLTLPDMTVTAIGDALQVMFQNLPQTVAMTVTIWKEGEEFKASTHVISRQQNPLLVSHLQEGAYCITAQAHMDVHNKSSSTDSRCVSITGPGTTWIKPTTVTVIVLILAGLVLVLSWSLTTCNPESCRVYLRKEQLPSALWFDWPIKRLELYPEKELCEPFHSVLLICPPTFEIEQTG